MWISQNKGDGVDISCSVGEVLSNARTILKNASQEFELDVFPPQRNPVFLLKMPNLVPRKHAPYRPIGISASVRDSHRGRWIEFSSSRVGLISWNGLIANGPRLLPINPDDITVLRFLVW